MQQLKILNKKEIKGILSQIEKQWGAKLDIDLAFLKNQKNRIYLVNKDISKIELSKLRINTIGMYFCEVNPIGIRLSIEGSQIIGPKATKNIAELDENQGKQWIKGEDLEIKGDYSGFVIIKSDKDYIGTGKYKDGKIFNYVGKERRISITAC